MQKFAVTGMTCAACVARVEKAVSKVPGVNSVSVSLLTNSMGVEGKAADSKIIDAVLKAGYGASSLSAASSQASSKSEEEKLLNKSDTPLLLRRLLSSLVFLLVLMYFSMGHMMWNFPIPAWFEGNHMAMGLVQLFLCQIILVINRKFFINGFKSLLHGSPNMDTLVALGSGISYIYSVAALFLMTKAVVDGNQAQVIHYMENFYFESSAMIVTLITVGKLLESISKGRTTDALKALVSLAPDTALIIRDGKEVEVALEEVKQGDIFVVKPGDKIPVDGTVIEGSSSVNESALTGESIPVDKAEGLGVSAGTMNVSGYLKCRADHVGSDTTLSKIIQLVSDAAATKAPVARIADKVSAVFVPAVISIAVITFSIWLFKGADFTFALSRGIAVLVISCPCALGLATPVAIMVGNGKAARNGILFKTSLSLEETGRVKIAALDKTGTITKGQPEVTNILCYGNVDEKTLLTAALSLEAKSEHPLARAIVEKGSSLGLSGEEVSDFEAIAGKGLKARFIKDNKEVYGGNQAFIASCCSDRRDISKDMEAFASQGKTPLIFAEKDRILGIVAVADTIKEDSALAISQLRALGIKTVMLTGDNEVTARAVAESAGVDQVIAGVLPDEKEKYIRSLMEEGKVCMVGDGINDAPALTRADVGIAIGAGTDVAIDAADLVLMKSSLSDVVSAIRLSRRTLLNIKENLFWAFIYNIIGIPLAAGVFASALGWELNPMFGAAAMSMSSFCVVSNALRLNFFRMKNNFAGKAKNTDTINSKEFAMADVTEKVIKVEGMMCEHCEAHVKEALEAIKGIDSAKADHTKNEVLLTMSKDVDSKKIAKAVEKAGYKYIE
ncbi:heavy metal translocating P-type ATPase [Treponema sp.]|uniref:heavy metal translocating P-type ATPase n=1 Tax=Treponema sp. TaxID=166 RepID=UPI0025CED786|nr:heavy metal translocating P-type ATPase [Treponema sp.]MCR5217854.1 heavy metal translocating P-type ATPase [Treponema sp.]